MLHSGIDREFERLLIEIFGDKMIRSFRSERSAGWVGLMVAFESRKRAANPFKTATLNVPLPFSFIDYHSKHMVGTDWQLIDDYSQLTSYHTQLREFERTVNSVTLFCDVY